MAYKYCVCGKICYSSIERANKEADYKLTKWGNKSESYQCSEDPQYFHLTTQKDIRGEQLLLGNLDKNHTMELKMPSGKKYLVTRPSMKLERNISDIAHSLNWKITSDNIYPILEGAIFPVAVKEPSKEWLSFNPWVAKEISKHKHRALDIGVMIAGMPFNVAKKSRMITQLYNMLNHGLTYSSDERIIRIALDLDATFIVPVDVNDEIGPVEFHPPTPKKKVRKKRKEILVRKFVTLTEVGLKAWNEIESQLGEGETMSAVIQVLIINESNRRS